MAAACTIGLQIGQADAFAWPACTFRRCRRPRSDGKSSQGGRYAYQLCMAPLQQHNVRPLRTGGASSELVRRADARHDVANQAACSAIARAAGSALGETVTKTQYERKAATRPTTQL